MTWRLLHRYPVFGSYLRQLVNILTQIALSISFDKFLTDPPKERNYSYET